MELFVSQDEKERRFEELFEAYRSDLVAYCSWRAASPSDAQDAVADVFLAAWRRLDDVPDGDVARVWLYATTRRVLANQRRARRGARRSTSGSPARRRCGRRRRRRPTRARAGARGASPSRVPRSRGAAPRRVGRPCSGRDRRGARLPHRDGSRPAASGSAALPDGLRGAAGGGASACGSRLPRATAAMTSREDR